MSNVIPPHEVQDNVKLVALIESFRTGKPIPAIVAYENQAICGSHRIHAQIEALDLWNEDAEGWQETDEPTLRVIDLSCADFRAASEHGGVDSLFDHSDYNDICEWVLKTTNDKDVIAALEDQVY